MVDKAYIFLPDIILFEFLSSAWESAEDGGVCYANYGHPWEA